MRRSCRLCRFANPARLKPRLRTSICAIPESHRGRCLSTAGVRPPWVDIAEVQLKELLALRRGWDGRWAAPVTVEAVETVIGVLEALMTETSLPPQFFPLADGGIQLEWHAGGDDIEVEVDGAGEAHVLAIDSTEQTVADGILTPDHRDRIDDVARFLGQISDRVRLRIA